MWKTFVMSPAAGGLAAIIGWIGAVLIKSSMSAQDFADLRFGWEGAMIGAIAVVAIGVLAIGRDMVDPVITVGAAAVGAVLLWDRQELPVRNGFRSGTTTSFWFTITMMVVVFVLLVTALRAARESNRRAGS